MCVVCMHVCMGLWGSITCASVHTCVCMHMGRPEDKFGCPFQYVHLFLNQGFSPAWSSLIRLDKLASELPGYACVSFLSVGIIGACHHTASSHASNSVLMKTALYWLSCFFNSLIWLQKRKQNKTTWILGYGSSSYIWKFKFLLRFFKRIHSKTSHIFFLKSCVYYLVEVVLWMSTEPRKNKRLEF